MTLPGGLNAQARGCSAAGQNPIRNCPRITRRFYHPDAESGDAAHGSRAARIRFQSVKSLSTVASAKADVVQFLWLRLCRVAFLGGNCVARSRKNRPMPGCARTLDSRYFELF